MQNKDFFFKKTNASSFNIEIDFSKLTDIPEIEGVFKTKGYLPLQQFTEPMRAFIQKNVDCDVGVILGNDYIRVRVSDDNLISKVKEYAYKVLEVFPEFAKEFKGTYNFKVATEYVEKIMESNTQKETLEQTLTQNEKTVVSVKKKNKV